MRIRALRFTCIVRTLTGTPKLKQQQKQNDGMGAGNSRKGIDGSLGPMRKRFLLAFFI
jgi:hypothetical protein